MFVLYLFFLAVTVLHGVKSQDSCTPEPVNDLQLESNATLHWQGSTNCENTVYYIYITSVESGLSRILNTGSSFIHISSLPLCELFDFTVTAVAGVVTSEPASIEARVPAMPGIDLTVTDIRATPQSHNTALLEWKLDPEYEHCIPYFRVVYWNADRVPVDIYTPNDTIILENLAPCTRYDFTVRPIYENDEEGGVSVLAYDAPEHILPSPTLSSISSGARYINMTCELPFYYSNRCNISSIIVDGSPYYPNQTISVTDSIYRESVHIHVGSLQPDSMYMFRVSLVNSAGASQYTPIGIQTLPESEDLK